MKVEDIFKVNCLKLYYKLVNNQLPYNIKKLFNFVEASLNIPNPNFHLVHFLCDDASGKKRVRYHLPKLINDTDINLLRNF